MSRPIPTFERVSEERGAHRQRKRPRPQIQRAFLSWLEDERPRLSRAVVVTRRTDQWIDFGFDVPGSALQGRLDRYEMMVWAYEPTSGEAWDGLFWQWVDVAKDDRGYFCSDCPPENQTHFSSRSGLWRHDMFEPFLHWVNHELSTAKNLLLFQTGSGGATWAKLDSAPFPEEGKPKFVIAL